MNDTNTTSSPGNPTKPTIIGLYGVSGSGKSYLLKQLGKDDKFANEQFTFYDGSALIEQVVNGGLAAFKQMKDEKQSIARGQAILHAAAECEKADKVGVVVGHHMFWENEDDGPQRVGTKRDWETYTHIIYLNVHRPATLQTHPTPCVKSTNAWATTWQMNISAAS